MFYYNSWTVFIILSIKMLIKLILYNFYRPKTIPWIIKFLSKNGISIKHRNNAVLCSAHCTIYKLNNSIN